MNGLRNLGDQLKDKIGEGVVVIASVMDGKEVSLMATSAADEAQKKGAHAGNLIKAIAGLVGGGGGRQTWLRQAERTRLVLRRSLKESRRSSRRTDQISLFE